MTKALISSMRLRTLPLSLAGVLCGGMIAYKEYGGRWWVIVLLALTACALQVLSNLSNEMGDYRSGVDSGDRQGPVYGLANGLTVSQLWKAINAMVIVCAISGMAMLLVSFKSPIHNAQFWVLLLLGAVAIWAATHYTLGKRPYGHAGLGDVFVFVFFGLVSVWGGYYMVAHTIDWEDWLISPAIGMGLLSVGVLNINNIRDMAADKGVRKTVPLRIGLKAARWYQTVLAVVGFFAMIGFIGHHWLSEDISILGLGGIGWCTGKVWRETGRALDKALPAWVISTFVLSLSTILAHYGL